MPRNCIVRHCGNKYYASSLNSFFLIPLSVNQNEVTLKIWAARCGFSSEEFKKLLRSKTRARICSEHFKSTDILKIGSRRGLKKKAVPIFHLLNKVQNLNVKDRKRHRHRPMPKISSSSGPECESAPVPSILNSLNHLELKSEDEKDFARPTFEFSTFPLNIGEKKTDNSLPINSVDISVETNPKIKNEPCSSGFCSHYITLIEEKARNHKLNRKVEELEERILCLEELLMTQDVSETNIKNELVEEDEVEIKFSDTI